MNYSWVYAKINLVCISHRLCCLQAGSGSLDRKHECRVWWLLAPNSICVAFWRQRMRCSSAAPVDHGDDKRCCLGYRCDTVVLILLSADASGLRCLVPEAAEPTFFLLSFCFPILPDLNPVALRSQHTTSKSSVQLLILTRSLMHVLTCSLLHMLKSWACQMSALPLSPLSDFTRSVSKGRSFYWRFWCVLAALKPEANLN